MIRSISARAGAGEFSGLRQSGEHQERGDADGGQRQRLQLQPQLAAETAAAGARGAGGGWGLLLSGPGGALAIGSPASRCRPGPYLLQLASSTIQLTSSANVSPACAASSGTSEVAVMPGCVFTSRQTNSPVPPGVSS